MTDNNTPTEGEVLADESAHGLTGNKLLERRLSCLARLKNDIPSYAGDAPKAQHYQAMRDAVEAGIQALRTPSADSGREAGDARLIALAERCAALPLIGEMLDGSAGPDFACLSVADRLEHMASRRKARDAVVTDARAILARHRLASPTPEPSVREAVLREALEKAIQWFREYERQHRAKFTTEGDLKADVNADRAVFLEAALKSPSPEPIVGQSGEEG